jgi:cation:H+ antiporter
VKRLSLLLTLIAGLFFTAVAWALSSDGKLDRGDGLVLIGLFFFWQSFHLFDVMRTKAQKSQRWDWTMLLDLLLLGVGAWVVYASIEWVVGYASGDANPWIAERLGWLSGWLMVLPNALLAFYYARKGRTEVVYSSQVGDGHICIPLCVGIGAFQTPILTPTLLGTGVAIISCAFLLHFVVVLVFGRLPRVFAWGLAVSYGWFLWRGF